jgi:DNA-binding MarR family transcriptional regulator
MAQGRFGLFNAFVDCSMAGLSRAELAVWLVLFRDCRDGTASTSQSSIAQRAGCNVRTVRRALARLESAGLIKTLFRGGLHRGPSRYRVRSEITAE